MTSRVHHLPRSIYCIGESDSMDAVPCKIGISTDISCRLSSLQGGNWRELFLLWNIPKVPFDLAKSIEERTLMWFRPSPYTGRAKNGGDRLKSEWIMASAQELFDHVYKQYEYLIEEFV